MDFIINDFDDCDLHRVALTDPMPPAEPQVSSGALVGQRMYDVRRFNFDLSECDPLAFTFTLPLDSVYKVVTDTTYSSNGRMKQVKKNLLVRDMSPQVQWNHMQELIDKWRNRLETKFRLHFMQYEIYPELTQKGLIHAHGLLYHDCCNYVGGRCAIFAAEWCYISKGSVRATTKINHMGKIDYAFAKCSNVESWKKYITKEFVKKG